MIVGISKEDGDRVLTDFLVNASKKNGAKECAEESYKIMDDFNDSQLVISIIISESLRESKQFPEDIRKFEVQIMSALATLFSTCDKSDVPHQFKDLFFGTEDEVTDKVSRDKKLQFAIRNFVSSFYHFNHFENKYPEITNML
jgi:hypothetical protein